MRRSWADDRDIVGRIGAALQSPHSGGCHGFSRGRGTSCILRMPAILPTLRTRERASARQLCRQRQRDAAVASFACRTIRCWHSCTGGWHGRRPRPAAGLLAQDDCWDQATRACVTLFDDLLGASQPSRVPSATQPGQPSGRRDGYSGGKLRRSGFSPSRQCHTLPSWPSAVLSSVPPAIVVIDASARRGVRPSWPPHIHRLPSARSASE